MPTGDSPPLRKRIFLKQTIAQKLQIAIAYSSFYRDGRKHFDVVMMKNAEYFEHSLPKIVAFICFANGMLLLENSN